MEEKILAEKDQQKQKRLSKELDIIKAQRAKGEETLRDLENS